MFVRLIAIFLTAVFSIITLEAAPQKTAVKKKHRALYRKKSMAEKIVTPFCPEAVESIKSSPYFRVVVFGASNTERYMPGLHWSDILEVGIRNDFGRKFHLINSGVSGNNTREALKRFDRDVASFKPDIVIVTLGGNDCNPKPEKFVSESEFAANMDLIVKKIRDLGALPIIQTYYNRFPCGCRDALSGGNGSGTGKEFCALYGSGASGGGTQQGFSGRSIQIL